MTVRDVVGDFSGKVALVTGAASGIGRALCGALCERGATVYATDVAEDALRVLEEEAAGHGEIRRAKLDVTRESDFRRVLDQVIDEHGRLDLVINNAGIGLVGDFRQIDIEDLRRIIDVNLWGVVYGTKLAYDIMAARGNGHIVNIASSAGVMPVPMQTAYAMSKHAVVGLSRSLRIEAAVHGVKVSAVLPGLVDSRFFESAKAVGEYDYEEEMDSLPIRSISPGHAAELILDGVRANRELIVFPTSNRVILWLFRNFPRLMTPLLAKTTTRSLRA